MLFLCFLTAMPSNIQTTYQLQSEKTYHAYTLSSPCKSVGIFYLYHPYEICDDNWGKAQSSFHTYVHDILPKVLYDVHPHQYDGMLELRIYALLPLKPFVAGLMELEGA